MPEQQGVMSAYQLSAHTHQGVGQGGILDRYGLTHANPDTIVNVLSDHNKIAHDALNIDADQVDGIDIPNTIANVLTNHTKAVHDALNIDADTLDALNSLQFIRNDLDGNVNCHIEWQDNFHARFGNDADFRIWHDGGNSILRSYKHGANILVQAENAGGVNRTIVTFDPDLERVDCIYIRATETIYANKLAGGDNIEVEAGAGNIPAIVWIENGNNRGLLQYDSAFNYFMLSTLSENADIYFDPDGTGKVRFGTHVGLGGESVTGYILIKDAGGASRKVAIVS